MSSPNGIILAVDDEPEIRGMLVDCLEAHGYTVLSAGDAAEALRLLELHPETGLLLTDVVMPGSMNGFDLAHRAQRVRPGIRVVFMTAYAAATLIGEAMLGPPVILKKPFWFAHLIQIVGATFAPTAADPDHAINGDDCAHSSRVT
jgi:CheY-like chemotaxis protein